MATPVSFEQFWRLVDRHRYDITTLLTTSDPYLIAIALATLEANNSCPRKKMHELLEHGIALFYEHASSVKKRKECCT